MSDVFGLFGAPSRQDKYNNSIMAQLLQLLCDKGIIKESEALDIIEKAKKEFE